MIQTALINTALPAKRLCIEITETSLIDDNVNAKIMLQEFQKLGVKLALDDFGTGYSSLSYVCQYAFDSLKIDKSFIENATQNPQSRAVIDAVVGLGTSLGVEVIAEGIETPAQLQLLKEAGCRFVQGYLVGRPATVENILHVEREMGGRIQRQALAG
jgi:Amt family ammonium transporter